MSVMADLREMQTNRDRRAVQQPMRDLRERLIRGLDSLEKVKGTKQEPVEISRLGGKIEGVKLTISYIEEALRA